MIEVLLGAGADVNDRTIDGWTPLMAAASTGQQMKPSRSSWGAGPTSTPCARAAGPR
ncbi:MAG: ankyrin repeat domain-containing protein [Candidatus Binatia bacterium]